MERARRLRELWAWLPTFRAAAETGHLPTAADTLHVGASSISRTVRLLEESLDAALFERGGRTLRLNRRGTVLLDAVRAAMRIMDEAVQALSDDALRGPIHLAAPAALATTLSPPIIVQLQQTAPELVLNLHAPRRSCREELLQGRLDAAVLTEPVIDDQLAIEPLITLERGLYAAPAHPLAQRAEVDDDALSQAPFVVTPNDGWPVHRPRLVGASVPDATVAARLCARAQLVAALPAVVAEEQQLHRLPCAPLPASQLYLQYRRPVADHARTEALLSSVRHAAALLAPAEPQASAS